MHFRFVGIVGAVVVDVAVACVVYEEPEAECMLTDNAL
jgi:hypothetical protein